jgi:hypothetical protein
VLLATSDLGEGVMNVFLERHVIAPILAALILGGCAGAPMQQQEARAPTGDEGIVVGSVLMKGGRDILGRTKWDLAIVRVGSGSELAPDYSISAHRGGDEEVFVTTAPAGWYRIIRLQLPFSNFSYPLDWRFQVQPGKTLYIGRLLIEFPDEMISIYTGVRLRAEDQKDTTIAKAEAQSRRKLGDVTTQLMTRSASGLPGNTTASPLLEKDTLRLIMIMDGGTDSACKQRTVENREIISADATGAQEKWTLDRCGTLVLYQVAYTPSSKGGTDVNVKPGEVIGKK